jgi:hypothetical protein
VATISSATVGSAPGTLIIRRTCGGRGQPWPSSRNLLMKTAGNTVSVTDATC